ncbi:hypothetical protein [Mycobacteroides abscessus]|uniref:hypothetical protein n=1 Tax=Mycobacteroides abscessus TaxID=36809 RepID=UPI000C268D28|nr:hypothetical protein [Mycobacteroides abscessus]
MRTYDIQVTRDGKWWMINVPEIDQLTQARHDGEVEQMARELIASWLDISMEDVAVHVIPGFDSRFVPSA